MSLRKAFRSTGNHTIAMEFITNSVEMWMTGEGQGVISF